MDISVFNMIAQLLGFDDPGALLSVVGGGAAAVMTLSQSVKALLPKLINNSKVLYFSAAASIIPAVYGYWPAPFALKGLLQGAFVGVAIFLTATGIWSGLKTVAHKVGTPATNASGGAPAAPLGGSGG